MKLTLMYITNNPEVAIIAQRHGVDRIWIDLETLGKEERQAGMNTVKSKHSIEDIKIIAPFLNASQMLVRVNPWNENSSAEIDAVIEAGAEIIMLPMWKSVAEVASFVRAVNGRVKTTLLLETKEAVQCLDEVLKLQGVDEIHIGLNDLHLSYGYTFMFELLADGTVEKLCNKIRKAGLPYGFGGIARIGEGALPAEKVIMEHYRLGSTRAILSRSFCNAEEMSDLKEIDALFRENMQSLRKFEDYAMNTSIEEYKLNKNEIEKCVATIVNAKRGK